MTWRDLANEQMEAARRLAGGKRTQPRSACSRAYYAAYAAVAGQAKSGFPHKHGTNPGHGQLEQILQTVALHPKQKSDLRFRVRRLRLRRVIADYLPAQSVGKLDVAEALADAEAVLRGL